MIAEVGEVIGWLVARMTRELGLFAVVGFAIGGLDDLLVDLLWLSRAAWRRIAIYSRFPRATMATLPPPAAPGRIAIFVGAWAEGAVIGDMLRNAVETIRHDDYRIYVGTYPNDPDTMAAVRAVGDRRVRLVRGHRPGPTTKAECLNRIWRQMLADEQVSHVPFKAIVLHDAEDLVHPQELALYDRMIERFDLVQIPVLPLIGGQTRWQRMIAATYADEFAEAHGKSLVLREAVGAAVPSAGVGCAIGRQMMARIAEAKGGEPFDAESLTEDYELGLQIRALGGREAFVTIAAGPGEGPVAVRAHFPETMTAAVRQKTRWIMGIALAGWDRLRWRGGLAERWMRLRDRRTPIAALVLAAAYLEPSLLLACWLFALPVVWPSAMVPLTWFTTGLLIWRLTIRALMVGRLYGPHEALLAIPRAFIGNLIDMMAAGRALATYVPGELPVWDKTQHRFPTDQACS